MLYVRRKKAAYPDCGKISLWEIGKLHILTVANISMRDRERGKLHFKWFKATADFGCVFEEARRLYKASLAKPSVAYKVFNDLKKHYNLYGEQATN